MLFSGCTLETDGDFAHIRTRQALVLSSPTSPISARDVFLFSYPLDADR
jgi:hypothetical protein